MAVGAGGRPDEAISWGKIRLNAQPVKIYGDSTFVFPLLVSQTFAKVKKEFDAYNDAAKERKDREWWKVVVLVLDHLFDKFIFENILDKL